MNNFSIVVQGRFMLAVIAGLTALLAKTFNLGNPQQHLNNALDSIEKFNQSLDKEMPQIK